METHQVRSCSSCGDTIRGRSDKLFCDDRCRNQHHNQKRKRPRMSERARTIQRQLVKNQGILQKHVKERRRCVVDRDQLLRDGFSFTLITHQVAYQGRGRLRFCFDLGYRILNSKRVEILRQVGSVGVFV